MNIYLDSCFIIYLLEGTEEFQKKAISLLDQYKNTKPVYHTSSLSILECLVKPTKDQNNSLVKTYNIFFQKFKIHPISNDVVFKALDLRVKFGFKTPDALQISAAIVNKSSIFVTGDQQLLKCKEISVVTMKGHTIG